MAKAADEEMKDAEPASTSTTAADTDASEAESTLSPTDQLAANLAILEKAVSLKETRMISGRLLRQTASIRHQLTPQILSDFVTKALPEDATMGPILLKQLKQVLQCSWCLSELFSLRGQRTSFHVGCKYCDGHTRHPQRGKQSDSSFHKQFARS